MNSVKAALEADPVLARLPGEEELPCEDGENVETERHVLQMTLLRETLDLHWAGRQDFCIGTNMFVYFSPDQVKNLDFKGPDVFVVQGVPRRLRNSWVTWEEGKPPDVVIELLSESTAAQDKGAKKLVYQDRLRVPEYFWFDPLDPDVPDFAGFSLIGGRYHPIEPDTGGRLISRQLGLALRSWEGSYWRFHGHWLRWETLDGRLLPTREEEQQRAEERAERLAAQLRAAGIEPQA